MNEDRRAAALLDVVHVEADLVGFMADSVGRQLLTPQSQHLATSIWQNCHLSYD